MAVASIVVDYPSRPTPLLVPATPATAKLVKPAAPRVRTVEDYPSRPTPPLVPATPATAKLVKPAAPRVRTVGLILLDTSLRPAYGNSEALRALAYPSSPTNWTALNGSLRDKVRALVGKAPLANDSPIPSAELVSGRRRYVCRSFVLDADGGQSSKLSIAILIERPCPRTADFDELAVRFRLTGRERESVEYLAQGLTGKEIAAKMNISPNTVKTFMRLVMVKMGVTTRSAIVGKIMTC